MSQVPGKVCVIVLNWNGWPDTLECLDSLTRLESEPESIVVVDNGSTDQSVGCILSWAEERFGHVQVLEYNAAEPEKAVVVPPFLLIRHPANLGFSGGNNSAISWALRQGVFDCIWLLNNDTTVRPDTLGRLLGCAEQTGAGVVGSTVVHDDRQEVVQCAGGCLYNPLTTVFRPYLSGTSVQEALLEKDPPDLDYIFGASLFVRGEVFARCGLLNEEYFLYYEEIDFCKRVQRAGYTLFWCPEAVVRHKGSSSAGKQESAGREKEKKVFANYHENLSTLLFTWRFYPWLLPLALLFRFFGKFAVVMVRGDWFLIQPLLMAYFDFFMGRNRRDRFS